ncbi:hypothetical protein PCASD_00189 [Puccinia coronata f. sp. avenae]|uniref:Uncharacterized protein n=1 Tax=Puccinia coronata f. sp. avenae TaxID=200324 RepID=A0A2N5VQH1_9BASI|nr:hypothetical protein PCASD_00189 [Puccinia coronata f. sp. avenae]
MHGGGVSSWKRPGTRSLNSVKKRREPVPARDAVSPTCHNPVSNICDVLFCDARDFVYNP